MKYRDMTVQQMESQQTHRFLSLKSNIEVDLHALAHDLINQQHRGAVERVLALDCHTNPECGVGYVEAIADLPANTGVSTIFIESPIFARGRAL